MQRAILVLCVLTCVARSASAEPGTDAAVKDVMPRVVAWRRDIHAHPELGNRETRTAKLVADHLRALKLEVRTGVAHTGVVGVLRGGKPGPVIAIRADMDALPVTEQVDVPFRSLVKTEYRGEQVGVMHACGHDGHVAVLMGVAQVLASMREQLPGTVVLVFQPAEEGAPDGEEGGAKLMLEQDVLEPRPEAMFGMHLWATLAVGEIGYRAGPAMAGTDTFHLLVTGRQTHGGQPWRGVDPIVTAAQIITSMQTVVSRQTDITRMPVVVSVGAIKGGIRNNIIPDSVDMLGTIRTYDATVREQTIGRVRNVAEHVAMANGATATLEILPGSNAPLVNDPALTARMLPSLRRAAGAGHVGEMAYITAGEDFAAFARAVPSLYFFVGTTPAGQDPATAPANHSPRFYMDEGALDTGVRAMLAVALDYLDGKPPAP